MGVLGKVCHLLLILSPIRGYQISQLLDLILAVGYVEENAQHPTGDVLKVSLLRYQFFCIPGSIVLNWPNVFWQNL